MRDVKLGPGVHASRTNVICVHGLIRGIDHGACSSLPALADEAYAPARARSSESCRSLSLDAMVEGSSGQHVRLRVEGCKLHARDRYRGLHFQISCIKHFLWNSVNWLMDYSRLTHLIHQTQGKSNIKELRRHPAGFNLTEASLDPSARKSLIWPWQHERQNNTR